MSDIVHRLRTHIAQAKAMFASQLLEDAAREIDRLRDLQASWHAVRAKLEQQIAHLKEQCQKPQDCPRSPEATAGDDPYSRDPIGR